MSIRRKLKLAAALIAGAIVVQMPVLAQAQNEPRGDLVWPPITVTLSVRNGWIVAEGHTHNGVQQTVWRRPVAPAGRGASINYGWGSVFVQVDNRRFVIDNATGAVRELQGGETVRQAPSFEPGLTREPPPASEQDRPESPGTQEDLRSGEYQLPDRESPLSPERAELLRQAAQPTLDMCRMDEPALERLCRANGQLMEALQNYENVKRLMLAKAASPEDLRRAQNAVSLARRAVDRAQSLAVKQVAPEVADMAMDVQDRTPPEVRQAEQRVLRLLVDYNRTAEQLKQIQAQATDTQPIDARRVESLQQQLVSLDAHLQQANAQLSRLRLAAQSETPTTPAADEPTAQQRLTVAQERLEELGAQYQQVLREYNRTAEAFDQGQASAEQVTQAQSKLMQAMGQLTAARERIDELRQEVRQASDTSPASEPAGGK